MRSSRFTWPRLALVALTPWLASCSGSATPPAARAVIFSRWAGYGYIAVRSPISISMPVSRSDVPRWVLATLPKPARIQDASVTPYDRSWDTLTVAWDYPQPELVRTPRLWLYLRSTHRTLALDLGSWNIRVVPPTIAGPLLVVRQSLGMQGTAIPTAYPFSITVKVPHWARLDLRHVRLLLGAPSNVVSLTGLRMQRSPHRLTLTGVLQIHDTSRQLYLDCALAYTYAGRSFTLPLWPIILSVLPSPAAARAYGTQIP